MIIFQVNNYILLGIVEGCSTVQKIVIEIVIEIGKPCSTMQKFVIEIVIEMVIEIVIEICMEQTRLFQCNWFHNADFRD